MMDKRRDAKIEKGERGEEGLQIFFYPHHCIDPAFLYKNRDSKGKVGLGERVGQSEIRGRWRKSKEVREGQ